MVIQINPALARLWLDANSRQFGLAQSDPLENLNETQLRILDYLEQGVADNQARLIPKMAMATDAQVNSLIQRISPLLVKTSSFGFDEAQIEQRFTEIMRLFLLGSKDPAAALRNRAVAKVFINKFDRVGLIAMRALAAVGIGTVFTTDHERIKKGDTLELGYPASSEGESRIQGAKALLGNSATLQLHSRISEPFELTDVALLISSDVVLPQSYQTWMARDVPHIAIIFDETGAEVSPLILPGTTACLACIEKYRLANQQNWGKIAPQLALMERNLSDSASLLVAVGLAVSRLVNQIDNPHKPQDFNTAKFFRSQSEVTFEEPHDLNCGCRLEKL
jgi:hypothetical protein